MLINVAAITGAEVWGRVAGRQLYSQLLEQARLSAAHILTLDLTGITRIDVPAARESVVEFARALRPQRNLCLIGVIDIDIIENIDGAAIARGTPLIIYPGVLILGPKAPIGLQSTLEYVLTKDEITARNVADGLSATIQNASNKLKALYEAGYILRREQVAATGGREYIYQSVKP